MVSVGARKSHTQCKRLCDKYRSCPASGLSLDTTALSIRTGEGTSFENTPSPSSTASASTIDRSPKYSHRILSSTLKNDHRSHVSFKRRSRYEKLFHHTQIVNRQYMLTMTNILYQMHKEICKLKKRTHRMEQVAVKQTKVTQPIIRIPRLTKDQLSNIYIDDDDDNNNNNNTTENVLAEENEVISDEQNVISSIVETAKSKIMKKDKHKSAKHALKLSKKRRRAIWINNRQKPVDLNRYCSLCRHEFSRRFNFLVHVRNVHKGRLPPQITEEDQSLLEMNAENTNESFHEDTDNRPHEITHDQSVVVVPNDETESSQTLVNPTNASEGRLRPRSATKSIHEPVNTDKVKCDICNKFFRANYLKKHKQGAHRDQQISSSSLEINNNSDQFHSTAEKSTVKRHLSNENSRSIGVRDPPNTVTPSSIDIAEMNTDDETIRFRAESKKSIVVAVTCLEGYQLELVDKFIEKFSPHACQTSSIDSRTTHLIANDEQHSLRSPLSMKLIEAIAHHCFCVSYRWIIDCLKYDRIVDEEVYEIEGDDTDVHPHGGPRRSRSIVSRHSLFENICFMIKCTENSGIQMTNERLEDLITNCGGQIITCVTQRLLDRYQIIVLCDMSYVSERRHNYDQCRQLGIHFVSSDWVLESILEYRKKPFSLFEEVPL